MVVSRKRTGVVPPLLMLKGQQLHQVDYFKHLGLSLFSNQSWSSHVENICSKARKLLGLLYRQYYQLAEPHTLLQLYLSLIHPHLEYASSVWNSYLQRDIIKLENVQRFGLKICSKQWDQGYTLLLELFNVPALSDLCTVFKIVHGYFYFPPGIFKNLAGRTHADRSFLFQRPFAHTNYFFNSNLFCV